jgi:hypothetical protein
LLCLPNWKQTQENEENSFEGNSVKEEKKWILPGEEYQCRIHIHMKTCNPSQQTLFQKGERTKGEYGNIMMGVNLVKGTVCINRNDIMKFLSIINVCQFKNEKHKLEEKSCMFRKSD